MPPAVACFLTVSIVVWLSQSAELAPSRAEFAEVRYRAAFGSVKLEDMTTPRAIPHLGHVDDEQLERLAVSWRAQALRGDREAYGIAHALEVERRRRLRDSQMAQLPPEPAARPRPWWKFWAARPEANYDPMSHQ